MAEGAGTDSLDVCDGGGHGAGHAHVRVHERPDSINDDDTIYLAANVNTARKSGRWFLADRAGLGWHVQHAVADRRAFCALTWR